MGTKGDETGATTEFNITENPITPMGGFPHYGTLNEDWIMVNGSAVGTKKRVITLRKTIFPQTDMI